MVEKTVSSKCLYARNPDVVVKEEDEDGALVFNPDTDQILVLNPTAFFIWQQCDGTKDIKAIVRAVADYFENVPESEMAGQVEKYVENMVSAGFIGDVEK